jgi:hypothetical protein
MKKLCISCDLKRRVSWKCVWGNLIKYLKFHRAKVDYHKLELWSKKYLVYF